MEILQDLTLLPGERVGEIFHPQTLFPGFTEPIPLPGVFVGRSSFHPNLTSSWEAGYQLPHHPFVNFAPRMGHLKRLPDNRDQAVILGSSLKVLEAQVGPGRGPSRNAVQHSNFQNAFSYSN